ncbi:hypothetical protein HK102_010745 [Quaeritorhiza haematococci]|nr:hypothetical protein HK102_010745 [Quaeritorhiza haematococci]
MRALGPRPQLRSVEGRVAHVNRPASSQQKSAKPATRTAEFSNCDEREEGKVPSKRITVSTRNHRTKSEMELIFAVLLAFTTGWFSLHFTFQSFAIVWPVSGIFIAYYLQHPSARLCPTVHLAIFLTIFTTICTGDFSTIFRILAPLPYAVALPTCAYVVERLICCLGGAGQRGTNVRHNIDLHLARHMFLLMCGVVVGPLIGASLSRYVLRLPMTNKMFALWLCSDYIGNLLVIPCVLLADELPSVLRQWHAVWAYAVLIAINFLYVSLRILGAGHTQLGLYLAFPWLLLMTHLFAAAGTYTGCLLTGFISAITTAIMDDMQRNLYVHGHIFILFVTCVCFIEIFRQRNEVQSSVEGIVEERTAQLTKTLTQLAAADFETQTAFRNRTRLMLFLCYELQSPLQEVINLAEWAKGVAMDKAEPVLKRVSALSTYMTDFIDDLLDPHEVQISTVMPPKFPCDSVMKAGETVGRVAACLLDCSYAVDLRFDHEIENLRIALSKMQFSDMIRHLMSYVRGASPNQNASLSLTATTNDHMVCIKTSHPGSVKTKDELLELVMPSFVPVESAYDVGYEDFGPSLPIVRKIIETGKGCLQVKSFVDEDCIVITILLPMERAKQSPSGDGLGVPINT